MFANIKIRTFSLMGNMLLALAAIGGAFTAYTASTDMIAKTGLISSNTVPSLVQISSFNLKMQQARITLARSILAPSVEKTKVTDEDQRAIGTPFVG